jgi:hypothetical protein
MKRHRFDPFSFLFGAVFVTIGATFLFGASGSGEVRAVHVWPAAIVVVGLALVFWAIGRVLQPEPSLAGGSDRSSTSDATETLDLAQSEDPIGGDDVADRSRVADGAAPDAIAPGAAPEADGETLD